METKYYSINASLVRCSSSDFFDKDGRLFENKTFYIKDESNFQFKDRYYIGDIYGISITESDYILNENYYRNQIKYLKDRGLIYKIENHKELEFNFKLYLKTASESDLYITNTNFLIKNSTYYCINQDNQIIGPFEIHENHSGEKFRKFLDKGFLLVPIKKQTFESIKNQESA